MQITNVGEDYAYATWEGNEGDPWEFDDKDDQPKPIPLTPEILEKNGFIKVNSQSLPARERGLKHVQPQVRFGSIQSLPARERGLKQLASVEQLRSASLPARERGLKQT